MLASRKNISRIALLCFIVFLTAACGLMKKHKLTVGQAQNTNVPVPDDTSVPSAALPSTVESPTVNAPTVEIDTSLDQDIRTRHMEEKITQLENRIEQLENKPGSQTKPSSSPEQEPEQASLTPPAPTKPKQPVPPAEPEGRADQGRLPAAVPAQQRRDMSGLRPDRSGVEDLAALERDSD